MRRHRSAGGPLRAGRGGVFLLALAAWALPAAAPADDETARAQIARYVGTWQVEAFLAKPGVRDELHALLGPRLGALERNLSVNGGVEFIGGLLAVRGNAPRRGTEEEAVVCVQPSGATPAVHAAIYSERAVSVFSRQVRFTWLPVCIRDWVTLVNTEHAGRFAQPANVRMVVTR
jgi:hypothetical protein